jgi:hypothetical protein
MSVGGDWRLVMNSPMGKQDVLLTLKEEAGGSLTGTVVNQTNNMTSDIFEGTFERDEAQWKLKLSRGKMTLTFRASVSDDAISGKVSAGIFGKFDFAGQRV